MSKKINISLPKEKRLGQVGINNQCEEMTIIIYRSSQDIDIQFKDGTIVKHKRYETFLKGSIAYPKEKRLGETNINNQGFKMTIIKYKDSQDIDIQFEDGTIVKHKRYETFKNGQITHPDNARCLNKDSRIGETNINKQGLQMTIIAYRSATDLDVRFEDDTIVEHNSYSNFKMGKIANPNELSDGISIPEKFMINIFKELNVEYMTQLSKSDFEWCQSYKYDFYIPSLDIIIETHGRQHYEEQGRGRNLKEEQENDRLKKELALANNIRNYIIIDCRISELKWLRENVVKELNNYFDLSNINWELIWSNSLKSLVWEVKKLIEEGYADMEIVKILGIHRGTIRNYKRQLGIKTRQEIKQENLLKTKELTQQGKTVKEIAKKIRVSEGTVRDYKRQLNL